MIYNSPLDDPAYRAMLDASEARLRARGAVDWHDAKPGDLLFDGRRMVRRRIRTRREAVALAAEAPNRRVLIDGARGWGVTESDTVTP